MLFLFGLTNIMINMIINVNIIAVDWAFKIQIPLLPLKNSNPTVTIIPTIVEIIAAEALLRFVNKPNNNGAVIDTDIKE